jgi:hypothetical protein
MISFYLPISNDSGYDFYECISACFLGEAGVILSRSVLDGFFVLRNYVDMPCVVAVCCCRWGVNMKSLINLFAACVVCCGVVWADDDDSDDGDSSNDPTVISDISKSAVEKAVSYDGTRLLFGLDFGMQDFSACTATNATITKQNINAMGVALGGEYSHSFKNGLNIGGTMLIDVASKKTKDGPCNEFNSAANLGTGVTAKLTRDVFTPSFALKLAYPIKSYKSIIYGKAGVARVTGTYEYITTNSGAKEEVNANAMVPFLVIGLERKINKKFGVLVELAWSLKKSLKKPYGTTNAVHNIDVSRKDLRILGTFSLH